TTAQRHPVLPNLPSVAESGVPGYEAVGWYGMASPAGTPTELIARMNATVNELIARPALRDRLASQGADPLAMTPAAFGERAVRDRAIYARVIRDGSIRPD
ncbi:MAG: tripartite tricarboxylate transporter substrate binding protein, partial [Rhodospirillales bacterium]|nr:tripartite tricarboxylate transporter substrate binding protein [Rhodospirillales bacterium]